MAPRKKVVSNKEWKGFTGQSLADIHEDDLNAYEETTIKIQAPKYAGLIGKSHTTHVNNVKNKNRLVAGTPNVVPLKDEQ